MTLRKLSIIGFFLIGSILIMAQIITGDPVYITGPGFNPKCKIRSIINIDEWAHMKITGAEIHTVQGKKISMCCADVMETNLLNGGGWELVGKFCEGKKGNETCKILFDNKGVVLSESCE